jgi:hypothetical protein
VKVQALKSLKSVIFYQKITRFFRFWIPQGKPSLQPSFETPNNTCIWNNDGRKIRGNYYISRSGVE